PLAVAHQVGDVGAVLIDEGVTGRHACRVVERLEGALVVAAPGRLARAFGHRPGEPLGVGPWRARRRSAPQALHGLTRRLVLRSVAERRPVLGDGRLALPLSLVDRRAVVVRLGVERLEADRRRELLERLVVAAERAEGARVARSQGAVIRILADELLVGLGGLRVAARLEGDGGQVPVAPRRLGTEVARAPRAFRDRRAP